MTIPGAAIAVDEALSGMVARVKVNSAMKPAEKSSLRMDHLRDYDEYLLKRAQGFDTVPQCSSEFRNARYNIAMV
jgi:hypothetical protein